MGEGHGAQGEVLPQVDLSLVQVSVAFICVCVHDCASCSWQNIPLSYAQAHEVIGTNFSWRSPILSHMVDEQVLGVNDPIWRIVLNLWIAFRTNRPAAG